MNIGARLAVLANRPLDGSSARRLQITGSERRFPPRFNRESEPTGFSGQHERCPLGRHTETRDHRVTRRNGQAAEKRGNLQTDRKAQETLFRR